jgi:hypothetical protein
MRPLAIFCIAPLGLVLLTACAGRTHVEGALTSPPGRPPAPQAPLPEPRGPPPEPSPEAMPPAGIYFLHEDGLGEERCVFVGERQTGGGPAPRVADAAQARARAVLDMAEQTRWLGGNVVVLPTFQEDFRTGRLQGRVYRCAEPERGAIYQRAAARRQLTVVPPQGAP